MADVSPGMFGRIAAAVMHRPRRWALGVLLVTIVGGLLGSRLTVNPNILELLPPGDPTSQAIQRLNAEEGGANLLLIAVKPVLPPGSTAKDDKAAEAKLDVFMRELVTRFEATDGVEYALYDIDPALAWRIGLMQLEPEELQIIRDRIKGALAMGPMAANPFVASRLLDLGPLTAKLSAGNTRPVLTSADGISRVIVRPKGSAYDPRFARPFMHRIYDVLAEMNPEGQGLKVVWIGGAYRHAVEDLEGIIHDLSWTSAVSFTLIVLLIGAAFRDPRVVFLLFVPLIIGTIWTFGFARLAVGTLNTFTSFAGAVLLGLGIDFSIHLYSRYREERVHTDSLEEAVVRAWDRTGPPCLTAALTTAGGFTALWVAGFAGFRQLGTILAGGVLLCLVAVVVTLPMLILWREKQPHPVPLRDLRAPTTTRPPTYRLAPLGLLTVVVVSIATAFLIPRIGFQYDLSELRRTGLAYSELNADERSVVQDAFAPVMVSYPDDQSLAADYERMQRGVLTGRLPELGRVLSLYSILPVDQESRLAVLHEIALLARDPNTVYLPANVRQNLQRIAGEDLVPMTAADLPPGLRHVLGAGEGRHRMLLIPTGNMWDLRNNVKLHEAVQRWLPGRSAAGEYLATAVLYRLMQGDAPRVAGLALLTVFLLTWFDLRSFKRASGALAALVAGMCWAGAGLVLFRIKLSLVNFVGIPILLGIGVDVVIHLLHRLYEEGPGRVRQALSTTGWASALSAATTVLSFAALSVATSQGVRSLGMMIVLGLTLVSVAAFGAVPLGWMTIWKIRGTLPEGGYTQDDDLD